MTTRSGQHLKDWILAAQVEDLPGLRTFAHGLEKDWPAVLQGLTTRWNSELSDAIKAVRNGLVTSADVKGNGLGRAPTV